MLPSTVIDSVIGNEKVPRKKDKQQMNAMKEGMIDQVTASSLYSYYLSSKLWQIQGPSQEERLQHSMQLWQRAFVRAPQINGIIQVARRTLPFSY